MKLGVAVKILGQSGLKSSDTRRWQNNPHLSVSLAYLRDIFVYLSQIGVRMYRMASDLAPYVSHPELPQFHDQIQECAAELAAVGEIARQGGLRLSFHPSAYTVLNSPDKAVATKSATELTALAHILDGMQLGPEAVVVTHIGGLYDDKDASLERFIRRYRDLPEPARRRLVLENDDRTYTIADTYAVHQETGIRLVLDLLHHLCNPTPGVPPEQALGTALRTWPADQIPKIHFSTPQTAMVISDRRDELGRSRRLVRQPRLCQHADLIDPFAFLDFLNRAKGCRDFDVMLECKAKDLALLRLRRHLDRLAPRVVARHQIV